MQQVLVTNSNYQFVLAIGVALYAQIVWIAI